MSANETIADIAVEKREMAAKIRAELSQVPARREDELLEAGSLEREADRIEAAWKREREAVEADALSVGGFVEAARHRPGNAAAMREALKHCIEELQPYCDGGERKDDVLEEAKAALSAPPRNCDVGNAVEQTARRQRYCKWRQASLSENRTCRGCPVYDAMEAEVADCDLIWAQMPYAKEGGAECS